MNRRKLVLPLVLTSFLLNGCTAILSNLISLNSLASSTTSVTTSSSTESSLPTSSSVSSSLPSSSLTSVLSISSLSSVSSVSSSSGVQPFVPTNLSLLQDEMDSVGIPSKGNVKILVFLVDFSDSPSTESTVPLTDINKAFNGSSSETGFESLKSYYYKSSFGKLNLTADIFGYYRAQEDSQYYADLYYDAYPEMDLVDEVLDYYDNQIDYSQYDANDDGFIDGVYVLYTPPVDYENDTLWWAWQNSYSNGYLYDGMEPNFYMWAGIDFILEGDVGINARTFIHETGHMLGLDDYYDYEEFDTNNNEGGLGGADMMDYTAGDHNAFSKLILGWIDPLVVTETMDVNLLPYIESGQALLLIDEWNGTLFDEYLLITFYTPTGWYETDSYYYFTIPGIWIYHIDAELGYFQNDYYSSFVFYNNNSNSPYKLIEIVEADENDSVSQTTWIEDTDLFQEGDIFNMTTNNNYKWHGYPVDPVDFMINIVNLTDTSASLKIVFN